MRNTSHGQTWTGIIREHVEAWRKANDWSRETCGQMIVEAHERAGFHLITGVKFDPPSRDPVERMKANADRIWRWLDDASKDTNLLTANFLPSILAAMPEDRRISLVNCLLGDVGLASRALPKEAFDPNATMMMFKGLVGSTAKATTAFANLLDGIEPGELPAAQAAFTELHARTTEALQRVESKLAGNGDDTQ